MISKFVILGLVSLFAMCAGQAKVSSSDPNLELFHVKCGNRNIRGRGHVLNASSLCVTESNVARLNVFNCFCTFLVSLPLARSLKQYVVYLIISNFGSNRICLPHCVCVYQRSCNFFH